MYAVRQPKRHYAAHDCINMVVPSCLFIGLTNPAVLLLFVKISGSDLQGHMPSVLLVVNKHHSKCCVLDRATPDHAVQCYHHAKDRGSY